MRSNPRVCGLLLRQWLLPTAVLLSVPVFQTARAQDSAASVPASSTTPSESEKSPNALEEIVVSARKREESALSVPVTLTALTGAQLQQRAFASFDDLNTMVPQLQMGEQAISVQGGSISIRGISSGDSNTTGDQAVSFNIDGAEVARSTVRRMAEMDISQIEVLKGPQALFFGKNSPGGIISVHTADPTPDFQASASAAYEVVGHETTGQGYISGPITDTLGIRIAGYASYLDGWARNTLVPDGLQAPTQVNTPHDQEEAFRITLKSNPSDRFDARFKFNYGYRHTEGIDENSQYVYCPLGKPQLGDPSNCQPGNLTDHAVSGPNFAAVDPYLDGGEYLFQEQILSSLEMNYKLTDSLLLTSVTSWYYVHFNSSVNANQSAYLVYLDHSRPQINEQSEELRLGSDFKGPLNFTAGGLVGLSSFRDHAADGLFADDPYLLDDFSIHQKGRSYSFFGEGRWDIIDSLELSGGGRYSHEQKAFDISGLAEGSPPYQNESFHNFSPEVSATWRPTSKLTLYTSYREGFLSGGYNVYGVPYGQETTKGVEGGLKTSLLDDTLHADFAAYTYDTTGLQVSLINGAIVTTVNAGESRVRGAEGDLSWKTPVRGLSLSSAAGYNQGRYLNFNTGCYTGQTIAAGCNLGPGGGAYSVQSLAGRPLVHAPAWTYTGGPVYQMGIGRALELAVSGEASYTSSYYTVAQESPGSRIDGYWLLNSTVRLSSDNGWELALIGKNLTNKYYFISASEVYGSGTGTGTAGPATPADLFAVVSRGREVMLRLTSKFH